MKVIFVTYVNRSGSTYLLSRLDNHPNIVSCLEADVLPLIFLKNPESTICKKDRDKIMKILMQNVQFKNWKLCKEEVQEAINSSSCFEIFLKLLDLYRKNTNPQAQYIVFKATHIIKFINQIATIAKRTKYDFKYIVLVRDPREIFLSQRNTFVLNKNSIMNTNPLRTVYQWNYLIEKTFIFKNSLNINILKYEDLLNYTINSILKVLEVVPIIDVDDNGDKYFGRLSSMEKPMHENILKPKFSKNTQNCYNNISDIELTIIEKGCVNGMKKLEYENSGIVKNIFYYSRYIYFSLDLLIFFLKRILIILFRGKYFFKNQ